MEIVTTKQVDKKLITAFFNKHWGSSEMVISSGVYQCDELDGLCVLDGEGDINGLITYVTTEANCEVISLDSIQKGRGIGTRLLEEVDKKAKKEGHFTIRLVTTNDNLQALEFYQKRGYRMISVLKNAVEKARKIKPEIPCTADNGIPIRDEILLEKSM